MRLLALSVSLWFFVPPSVLAADSDFGQLLEKRCPDALREHEALAKKDPEASIDPSRPALAAEIKSMVDEDQRARNRLIAAMKENQDELPADDPAQIETQAVDTRNLRRLKHIVQQDGFPTIEMVGYEGVSNAFLLVQHAASDLAFQQQMLKIFSKRLKAGGIKGSQYAMLTDRVLTNSHRLQRYGTQFEESAGRYRPQKIEDQKHVDARRRALGMISLKNYTCEIEVMYGRAQN